MSEKYINVIIQNQLIDAIKAGSILKTKKLIKEIEDLNQLDVYILVLACEALNIKIEIIKLLLDKGADIHASIPLICACQNPHVTYEIIELLLDKGADIRKKDYNGWTALDHYCCNPHIKLNTLLLLLAKAAKLDPTLLKKATETLTETNASVVLTNTTEALTQAGKTINQIKEKMTAAAEQIAKYNEAQEKIAARQARLNQKVKG